MSLTELSGTPTPEPAAADDAPARPSRRASPLGALLLRLHFYAGVLVAPFLVVAALTGLAYTTTPQLDNILYGDQLTVAQVGERPLPLAEQVGAARNAHPDGSITAVQPGDGDRTTKVMFSLPELGDKQHTVYIDPYTAESQGQLTTWFGSTPAATWLDDLHRHLHLGTVGEHYSELAASWLWVLALGGVILWWRRRSTARATARHLLVPDLSAGRGVRRTRGWHATTGIWLAVGLLFLSATGLTWSRYAGANFSAGLDALDARTPEISTSLAAAPAGTDGGSHHHGDAGAGGLVESAAFDRVLTVARDAGLSGPVEIAPATAPGSAWTVTQTDNTWPVAKDRVAVDPATDTITDRSDFADWPLLAKLSGLGIQAHMGLLFGLANQILLAALALGLLCVIVWGYRMWWQRRPTRGDRRALAGTPPTRGGLRGLPFWALLIGVPVTVAIGWALPLFGLTLLTFLVVDVVVGAVSRRRRPAAAPTSPAPAGS
ncbi:PepSY-associated TM helix domain-containing protein [Micromonospora parathelypteridis]|uniref:Putative iron-regulated membrane protein n=1 Tax=Micromonospora parathelypteridis TaxID=1839617 RepID=A0A840VJV9_9ACTN|nr:PepSY-associated TM helix domain-containing protein [Micromonospora parathelypteridis]MBB5476146.1 putative iron-regulated membrane protein [Micromonospora parathelypteridis]GGO13609.1 membrane protein [Micromonospora parathelypteridis]